MLKSGPTPTINAVLEAPSELFIGGDWRVSASGERVAVVDPATGDAFATVAAGGVEDAMCAVASAHEAAPDWAKTAPRIRSAILYRAFQLTMDRRDEIATLIVRENGKSLDDALGEVAYAAEFFRWFAEEAVRIDGDLRTSPSGTNKILVWRQPIGLSLMITPWNFPAAMATRKIAPAIAAGCTVVLKPAIETPLTALLLAEVLRDAGVPPGVVNVVPTAQSELTVSAMLRDPRVSKLSFTGSTGAGRTLLRTASDRVLSCSMELGGNAPFIVFDDADVDAAVDGALVAKMRNAGEACTAANRFYVHTSLVETFAARLAGRMEELRIGPGLDPGTQVGPLINSRARDKVHALVTEALSRGGRLLTGGRVPEGPGYFYPPTVLDNVDPDAEIFREEIFGPVAAIAAFRDEREVVDAANHTEHGLAAYVYSSDLARCLRVSEQLNFGMVALNRGLLSDPSAPFGGVKQSGLGREGGHDGILAFLETKYIAANW